VEGSASRVNKEEVLRNVAQAYATKYGWQVSIRGDAFYAEGAPTAGPPPYQVFRMEPEVIFGFGTDDKYKATRWRF
jgi:hypothetical protein